MISLGSLKITNQAFIISIIGIVIGIFIAFQKMPIPGLMIMAGAFLAAYNANCSVIGHCDIWAWSLVIVYALNMFFIGRMAFDNKLKFI